MRYASLERINDAGAGIPHAFRVTGDGTARVLLSIVPAGIEDMFREPVRLPEGPPDLEGVAAICGRYGVRFVEP